MNRLWMFIFPLMFLPSLGFMRRTQYGTLETGDWLVAPLILALLAAPSSKYLQQCMKVKSVLLLFLAWVLISVLSIHFRYDYRDDLAVIVLCLLKLGKLAAYTVAGMLIPGRLVDMRTRSAWLWSVLAALLVISLGLLANSPIAGADMFNREAYKSYNIVIVLMSMLSCYIVSIWFDNQGSASWRLCAGISVVLAFLSIVLSASKSTHGRGGWLALAIGLGYLFLNRSRKFKTVAVTLLVVAIATTAYFTISGFQSLVDTTISPPSDDVAFVVDDGARLQSWAHEAPKWVNAPVFGSGLFHRGGQSGLWTTGSHSFFLQILLETGIVGFVLLAAVFWNMWRFAGSAVTQLTGLKVATRSALIAGIVAGITCEYFHGGIVVLALLSTQAFALSLPSEASPVRVAEPGQPLRFVRSA